MWYPSTKTSMESNVPENEQQKCEEQRDSSHTDSGFLSSGNLQVSSELGDYELNVARTAPVAPEPMRADSGVDLGLSESLSQLTLKQVTPSPLASGKVQAEPTVELTPVSTEKAGQHDVCASRHESHQPREKSFNEEEPWQLYYTQDDNGDTQLHVAIMRSFVEGAFVLISIAPHWCLLDILNDDGQSPLYLAVLTRQPWIVRRLIVAGANPALRNFRGDTALHLACAMGDLASAEALTSPLTPPERKCFPGKKIPALPQNLEQRNYDGEMCLHVAAASGHVELVRLLLRLGADLEAREALAGKTALHLAVERGCRSVVAFLLKECRPCLDTQTYAGITAYQLALCFDSQLARELVRLGATAEPLPESDSDSSDEDENSASNYLPGIARLRQSMVGVDVQKQRSIAGGPPVSCS